MLVHELNTKALGKLTEEEFMNFCIDNPELRIERNADGNIIVMSPTNSETGFFNSNVSGELFLWNKKAKKGYVFDSSTGFTLPNTAVRSPDAAFILKEKWETLPKSEKQRFAHICPDFVIEIVSSSDSLNPAQAKMDEWINQGALLGWLLNFENQQAWIYEKNCPVREHPFNEVLIGKYPVEGFEILLPEMME